MITTLAPALLAAKGGLTDFDATLYWSTLVLFVIFAVIMAKLAWNPLLAMIEAREKGVRESVEGAQRASAEAQALLAQHQELLREAGRQREEIIKRSIADAEQLKADLSAQARNEADQILRKAKEQIEREKRLAIQELRGQVADLAVEAASRIVTSSLTPEAQRKLVHEFIDKLPTAR
jgi:F-type H+-transporting ATPase subunit b